MGVKRASWIVSGARANILIRGKPYSPWVCLFPLLLICAGCVHFWGPRSQPSSSAYEKPTVPPPYEQGYEAALDNLIRAHIEAANRDGQARRSTLVKRLPYYLKEYGIYPEGVDSFQVVMQEVESRTTPYVADVRLRKVRFATRFHRSKDAARHDDDFLRDTGTEILTFEFQNGRWRKVGALFIAEKTEENVDGEWVAAQEAIDRSAAAEQGNQGWFKRAWSAISSR